MMLSGRLPFRLVLSAVVFLVTSRAVAQTDYQWQVSASGGF